GPLARRHPGRRLDSEKIHQAVIATLGLSEKRYGLNQLRYDLRKLKGHGLLERDGSRYAYRLTTKAVEVPLLFLFFPKRLCGPLPTAAFITSPTLNTDPIASSKPLITEPTRRSNPSSSCSLPLDAVAYSSATHHEHYAYRLAIGRRGFTIFSR